MLRNKNGILKESSIFSYVPKSNMIYINPALRLQLSPCEFVRELGLFCKEINIKEVLLLKTERNNIFIEKIVSEIKNMKDWTGPRICVLNNVKRIIDKDDQRVILNDFHILPTSGHAGIRGCTITSRSIIFGQD